MTLQAKLELSVAIRGINDPLTLILSRKRDEEIVLEQRALNGLVEQGRLRQMVREFKSPSREQDIYETIRRVEEM